jgi:prepilin-type N-terminal cleavage/methylation domain-containing protein
MNSTKSRGHQRGFSLAEVMVATAILVVILVGILMLYDRANRVFKSGNEAAELQQNVRIAYQRMVADVRMAGFDYKRGGPLLPGQTAAPWAGTRAYSAGTIVTPTVANGHTYRATNAGTSGTIQPAWPTGTGATVIEAGATPPITWQENGAATYEQPDEQIEYAGATALTVRGNFDYSASEPGDEDHGREPALELASPGFPLITTDNQEVVTYALVSNTAAAGTAPNNQSVSFFADINTSGTPVRVARPGGSAENPLTIPGVDLTNANPPYTLYRFTFADDGSVQRTALADNIRSLNYFYFEDTAGQRPLTDALGAFSPNIGGVGQFNPAVAASVNAPGRLIRKKIRAIRVRLVGMNAQPDVNYTETTTINDQFSATTTAGQPVFATDTIAPNYRKLTVDTLITPRNLGMTGLPQNFLQPPPRPTVTSLCIGYCGIAVVNWNPNTSNPNASYVVSWDTDPAGSFSHSYEAGTSNTLAVDLTQENPTQTFYFRVSASNAGGTVLSDNNPPLSSTVVNRTRPNPPPTIAASGGGAVPPIAGKIRVSWSAATTNASGAPICTPSGSPAVTNYLREIKGYRIFRGNNITFNASGTVQGAGTCILDEEASGPTAPQTDGYGNYYWDDTSVVCGQTYYYRLETVEWCEVSGTYNFSGSATDSISGPGPRNVDDAIPGQSGTGGTPRVPDNLEAAPLAPAVPQSGMTNSACNAGLNICDPINLRWVKVTTDTTDNLISIDSYDIERTQLLSGAPTGPPVILNMTGALAMPGSTVLFSDSAPEHDPMTLLNYEYRYRVKAVQEGTPACPDGNFSQPRIFPPPCVFTGSVVVQTGASAGDGLTPATAWVMNAGDTIQVNPPLGTTLVNTIMQIIDPAGTVVDTQSSLVSPALFSWANLTAGTRYSVTFTMTNDAVPPCTEQLVRYIQQEPLPACSLITFVNQPSILTQTATQYQLKLDLINDAPEPLTLTEIDFVWTVPARITWNSVQFPSGGAVPGPGTLGGSYIVTLSPIPAGLTVSDVTVPASGGGARSLLLNYAATALPLPANVTPSIISDICVKFTRASQGAFVFQCKIKPDQEPANPNFCQ